MDVAAIATLAAVVIGPAGLIGAAAAARTLCAQRGDPRPAPDPMPRATRNVAAQLLEQLESAEAEITRLEHRVWGCPVPDCPVRPALTTPETVR
ncbi:MAG: hypothetical protein M0P31_19190 [Solirubrobacteraceae bacterium]|nr:hypothetical protein [Solirubrobacteraceae bacterium]